MNRTLNFSAETLANYQQAMLERTPRMEVLQNATFPVLFILGKMDKAVPYHQAREQVYLPSISVLGILKNSAHMGMQEEPDKLRETVSRFLELTGNFSI